jgi:S-(hydroxymethyl)glutathione dehydrogenase/alcohol dehydrogenase
MAPPARRSKDVVETVSAGEAAVELVVARWRRYGRMLRGVPWPVPAALVALVLVAVKRAAGAALGLVLGTLRWLWGRVVTRGGALRRASRRAAAASTRALTGWRPPDGSRKGLAIECRAALALGPLEPVVVERVAVDAPGPGEVRVKMAVCAAGRADACAVDAALPEPADARGPAGYPCILGVEGAGVVESVGLGVRSVSAGDAVVVCFQACCYACALCKHRGTNLCAFRSRRDRVSASVPARASSDKPDEPTADGAAIEKSGKGKREDGPDVASSKPAVLYMGRAVARLGGCGTFSEYALLDEEHVARLDADVPLDQAALLAGCVGCGVGAAISSARPRAEPVHGGSREAAAAAAAAAAVAEEEAAEERDDAAGLVVAVLGLGPVGLAAVMALAGPRVGALRIVAVDTCPAKLEAALSAGATDVLRAPLPAEERGAGALATDLRALVGGGGLDLALECAGDAAMAREALAACHVGWGELVLVGDAGDSPVAAQAQQHLWLRPGQDLVDGGRKVRGLRFGGLRGRRDLPLLLRMVRRGEIDLEPFITATTSIDNVNSALDELRKGRGMRTVMTF